jgi:hypothetical protein
MNRTITLASSIALALALTISPTWTIVESTAIAQNVTSEGSILVTREAEQTNIEWHVSEEYSNVQIIVDGVSIASGPIAGEIQVDADTSSQQFTVVASRDSTSIEADEFLSSAANFTDSADLLETVAIIGVTLDNFQNRATVDSAVASPAATSTTLRYQTFIPAAYAKAPEVGCSYRGADGFYFRGDNRSYSAGASSSRTRFDTTVNWASPSISSVRTVGPTTVYQLVNASYRAVATTTAPKNSMVLTPQSATSTTAKFNIRQNVANPYCTSNGIYFDFDVTITRAGGYYLTGKRLRAPSHEVFIKDSDATPWTSVFQQPALAFPDCLIPVYSGLIQCEETRTAGGAR